MFLSQPSYQRSFPDALMSTALRKRANFSEGSANHSEVDSRSLDFPSCHFLQKEQPYTLVKPGMSLQTSLVGNMSRTPAVNPGDRRQDNFTDNRQTFYVRVGIKYLAGIHATMTKRRKGKSANDLVYAYAVLAKSGKRVALSHPLGPYADSTSATNVRAFWSSSRNGEQTSGAVTKRQLHFSMSLQREIQREGASASSESENGCSYSPEVVDLIVGLKCGNEQIPLGTANLVVNGDECGQQQLDIALRPIESLSRQEQLNIQNRSKARRDSRKKGVITFKRHDRQYRLATNATLRVVLDIKAGMAGASKSSVWRGTDEASRATNSASLDGNPERIRALLSSPHNYLCPPDTSSLPDMSIVARPKSTPASLKMKSSDVRLDKGANAPLPRKTNKRVQPPIKYISRNRESISYTNSMISDLTVPISDLCAWSCLSLFSCGRSPEDPYDLESGLLLASHIANSSTDSRNQTPNRSGSPSQRELELFGTLQEDRDRNENLGSETELSSPLLDEETVDMTMETFEDLKVAHTTLTDYARKAGVDMDILLKN